MFAPTADYEIIDDDRIIVGEAGIIKYTDSRIYFFTPDISGPK